MVGLVSAVLLVVAGVAGLSRRSTTAWWLLVAGHAAQVLLAAYWWIRLYTVLGDVPGTLPEGAFASYALVFAVAPLVGLGPGPAQPRPGLVRRDAAELTGRHGTLAACPQLPRSTPRSPRC